MERSMVQASQTFLKENPFWAKDSITECSYKNTKSELLCEKEGEGTDCERFPPADDFTVVKLLRGFFVQNFNNIGDFDIQNAFPNRNLGQPVVVKFPRQIFDTEKCRNSVVNLQNALHWIKDTSKIWHDLITKKIHQRWLAYNKIAPCIFKKRKDCWNLHVLPAGDGKKWKSFISWKRNLDPTLLWTTLKAPYGFLACSWHCQIIARYLIRKRYFQKRLTDNGLLDSKVVKSLMALSTETVNEEDGLVTGDDI